MNKVALESTLICPYCGAAPAECMPTDACLFFWYCPSCEMRVRPKEGDYCVFCSYGSVPCPPRQADGCCST